MANAPFECVVSADLFRRALLGVSTEEARFYLSGVHISAAPGGGATLVATNGSILIAILDRSAIVRGEGIVKITPAMKAALKYRRGDPAHTLLAVSGTRGSSAGQRGVVAAIDAKTSEEAYAAGNAVLAAPDGRVRASQFGDTLIDGEFPAWRSVIPAAPQVDRPTPALNNALLTPIAEALCDGRSRDIHFTASGPNEPVLITSASDRRFVEGFGIIMPIRTTSKPGVVPTWALPKKSAVAKAA